MSKINRRDFLKLAGAISIGSLAPQFLFKPGLGNANGDQQNVLMIIFDAWSAHHLSLHGYPRETMPNLNKLVEKAIVYHNHYSAGKFTTPGTASLLSGVLPWTHRATAHNDTVSDNFLDKNLFSLFPHYHRIAYSHNILANTLLKQFFLEIDDYISRESLFISSDKLVELFFSRDEDIASVSWIRALKQSGTGYSYSLNFPRIYEALKKRKINRIIDRIKGDFPRGLPFVNDDEYYILEDSINFMQETLPTISHPFLGYFHLLPPHSPYKTRKDFVDAFQNDGYKPVKKPEHIFSRSHSQESLDKWRTLYDEFILYADAEFARLYNSLEQAGVLENTWVILTSDHGELFERGVIGHMAPMMFQPVLKIPLIIFEPGRKSRLDVLENTSSIDVLPTLMKVTKQEIPTWLEGELLPPFNQNARPKDRDIYSMHIVGSDKHQPVAKASMVLYRGEYKLVYYFGYKETENQDEIVELYNVKNDPEELNELSSIKPDITNEMLQTIKAKLAEVNEPYL